MAIRSSYGLKCFMDLFVLWCTFGRACVDRAVRLVRFLYLDGARFLSNQTFSRISGYPLYSMASFCYVLKWNDSLLELKIKPPFRRFFFISLIFLPLDHQYLNILIQVLLHNQGCSLVVILCGG